MKRALLLAVAVANVWAAEPLLGTWRLDRQEVNGIERQSEPLTLKISPSGDKLDFAFSVPVNKVYFVSMTYTLKLDGIEADVKNSEGKKVGTIQMNRGGPSEYTLTLKGENRPDSAGKLTVSSDGKNLTSETETLRGGKSIRSKQFFSRY